MTSTVLLDTSVCIELLKPQDRTAKARLLQQQQDAVALCSIVKAELLRGARNSARVDENLQRLRTFFSPFSSLPFDDAAAEMYARHWVALRHAGTPIGHNDLLIASIALAADATVVTRNEREFQRVPGLRVVRW
jgi:tRNA(fMet)-specific endonuclease VapC